MKTITKKTTTNKTKKDNEIEGKNSEDNNS